MMRRSYFHKKVGFMKWSVFFSDDEFESEGSATDIILRSDHEAMVLALNLQSAYDAGAHQAQEQTASTT